MKIEIIEFYLHVDNRADDFINGDMKIRVPELGLDMLGVYIQKSKKRIYTRMPGRKTICKKTGLKIEFPYLALSNRDKQKELMLEIVKVGTVFIEDWLKKEHNPSPKVIEEPKPIQSVEKILSKSWDAPPPLKVRKRNDVKKY